MTTLISSYNLTEGTLVEAEVLAHNSRGWSAPSSVNTAGALVQTAPSQMTPVTSGLISTS
jgi:hypothetical protein